MNRTGTILLSLAMTLFATAPLCAQISSGADAVLFDRYRTALRSNFWQDGTNPAGIRQDSSSARIAHAELYGKISAGGFRQSHEASVPWSVGAKAESLVHLEKFSMQGSFSFEQMQGSDMCGSMFVNPGYYPVDALEFTPGRKIRQTYAFDGAISVDIAPQWRIGAGIDFTSANLAKRKDVRHSNYLLDMTVTPGVIWHGDRWAVGLDAIVRKTTDTPTAKQIGTKDTYEAFLDKGLYYGKLEDWQGSGLHLSEAGVSGLPVKEIFGGAGIQVQHGAAFADFSYLRGNGTIGEKQYVWFRFPSHNFAFTFGDRWKRGDYVHSFRYDAEWRILSNRETVLEKVTEGGVTTTVQHGSNRIFSQTDVQMNFEYSFLKNGDEFVVRAGVEETSSAVSQMYPYIVEQSLAQFNAAAGYNHHEGRFDIGIGYGYRGGLVRENERLSTGDSGVTGGMTRLEDYYRMDMLYKTAHRLNVCACLGYDLWKGLSLKVLADYTGVLSKTDIADANRVAATLKLEYNF